MIIRQTLGNDYVSQFNKAGCKTIDDIVALMDDNEQLQRVGITLNRSQHKQMKQMLQEFGYDIELIDHEPASDDGIQFNGVNNAPTINIHININVSKQDEKSSITPEQMAEMQEKITKLLAIVEKEFNKPVLKTKIKEKSVDKALEYGAKTLVEFLKTFM